MSTTTTTVLKRPPSVTTTMPATASPKISKTKLPVIQPPTYYGCEHIGRMFEQGASAREHTKVWYSGAARVALDAERLTAQKCEVCSYVLRRTYLCMQCPKVHCARDAEVHAREAQHTFGVDSRNGHVYCFLCHDYIYDPALEDIRLEQEASVDGGVRKKRRLEDSRLSPEDLKLIDIHTIPAPCRATGLRGFLNMGSTCFMSVVLQSLVHNPIIRNFYLSDGHKQKECTQSNCMSCAMDEVFTEFFTSEKLDGFGPINLLTTSWKCEQTLAGYQQQDAHEYLQFLLNQLHTTNGNAADNNDEHNSEECKCIIHRSFYGKLQSDVTCGSCRNVTTAYDPVMDLSLDLKLRDKKKQEIPGATVQSLQECLARFTAAEKLGANEYSCSKCSGAKEVTKQLSIKRLPPILCIQLKRFEHSSNGSAKIEAHIRFPMQLDMTPFTTRAKRKPKLSEIEKTKSLKPLTYDLLSVVVHKGEINSGHYINYARESGQWFQFDDNMVTLASEKQVLAAEAYLLFYIIRTLH